LNALVILKSPMFEILDHPADVGFRASGKTLPEMFEAAAEALVSIAMERTNVAPAVCIPLRAEGDSYESLLVNWLSEVLYQLDGEQFAMARFKVREISEVHVSGNAFGERRDPARHETKLVVKGVTYHQLKVEQRGQDWFCEVYLDV
jgi:SHS2 domain-containing protein